MRQISAIKLVDSLRGSTLRYRTGILLLPVPWLGREREVAARLGIAFQDERERVLRQMAPGQRFLGIGWQDVIAQHLEDLVRNGRPEGDCILIANLDLLVCSFSTEDRSHFWRNLREIVRPTWGLLLALPIETRRILTEEERLRWTSAGRVAIWTKGGQGL